MSVAGIGSIGQRFLERQRRLDLVLSEDVLLEIFRQGDMACGFYAGGVDFAQFFDVVEDMLELARECLRLCLIEMKMGQIGNFQDIIQSYRHRL